MAENLKGESLTEKLNKELKAIKNVVGAVEELTPEIQVKVLNYALKTVIALNGTETVKAPLTTDNLDGIIDRTVDQFVDALM